MFRSVITKMPRTSLLWFAVLLICIRHCLTFPVSNEAMEPAKSFGAPCCDCSDGAGQTCLQDDETGSTQTQVEQDETDQEQCCEEDTAEDGDLRLFYSESQKKCVPKKQPTQSAGMKPTSKPTEKPVPKPCVTPSGNPCQQTTPKPTPKPCGKPGQMSCEKPNAKPEPKPTPPSCGKPNQKPCEKPTEKPTKKPAPNTGETTPTPIQVVNYNYITIQMKDKKKGAVKNTNA